MGMTIDNFYFGHPIYIATKEWQRRKHRKKRINKKWLKRYGTYELNIDCMDSLGHVLARFGQSMSCDLNVQFHSIPNKDDGSLFVLEVEE